MRHNKKRNKKLGTQTEQHVRTDTTTEEEKAFDKKECNKSAIRRKRYLIKKYEDNTRHMVALLQRQIDALINGEK